MADIPGYVRACLHTGKLALLAILVSGGIVLQILVSCILPASESGLYMRLTTSPVIKALLVTYFYLHDTAGMCFV